MGNYKSRREGYLQSWQVNVADMMFRGMTDEEICIAQFGVDKLDEKKMRNGKARLRNLRRDPKFQEYYKSIITEWTVHNVGKALTRLAEQMDSDKPWIVNKACNDILNQSKQFTGTDDSTVKVVVEGMPELGTPEE